MTTRESADGRMTRRSALGFGLITCCLTSGCKLTGYSIRAPYDMNVKTVYVPTFQSVTFRRDLNIMLTELVIKEIGRRTPYQVVGAPGDPKDGTQADSTLNGTISYSEKNIVVESPYNLPRQLTTTMVIAITWTDNKAEPTNTNPAIVADSFNFTPEIGETAEAAFYKNCEKLATQVVNMMEQAW